MPIFDLRMRRMLWGLAPLLALASAPVRAGAPVPVDLELALAVDVSSSTDAAEFALMIEGYAAAFESQAVKDALTHGPRDQIAVAVYFWASFDTDGLQQVKVPFTLVSPATADAFAATLRDLFDPIPEIMAGGFTFPFDPPLLEPVFWSSDAPGSLSLSGGTGDGVGQTAVAQAVDFGRDLLVADNGFDGLRLVLDVSGDGHENVDFDPAGCPTCALGSIIDPIVGPGSPIVDRFVYFADTAAARDTAVSAGITINGLPILTDVADLDTRFYEEQVIGGPDAFLVVAADFDSFGAAVAEKLAGEIAVPEPGAPLLLGVGTLALALARRRWGT